MLMIQRSAISLVIALLSAPVTAHDLWIEPSSFTPAPHSEVALRLRVGENFAGDPVPRNPRRIVRFAALAPGGEAIPTTGETGADPAGTIQLGGAGLYIALYRSNHAFLELEARKFESYLREEGLEAVLAERERHGERGVPGRELYSRSVKALLAVGGVGGADRAAGLPLELIAEADPRSLGAGDELAVRLLFRGEPLAAAQVVAMPRADPQRKLTRRTDASGRAVFLLALDGPWLVKAVHMTPLAEEPRAQWESFWASLTFAIGKR